MYHGYSTQAGGGVPHIQHMTSRDLKHWTSTREALPRLPSWARSGATWAPEVLRRGSQYLMYYTASDWRARKECISVAVAGSPSGPFVDRSASPIICLPGNESIDASPFVASNGTAYLVWKSSNSRWSPTIYSQRLRSDGRALVGSRHALLAPSAAWEGGVIEGPSMVAGPGGFYLFYSANNWKSARYAVGYAVCTSPLGGCRKATGAAPWLASYRNAAGPGGQSFFRDVHGNLNMAYHAWAPGRVSYEAGGIRALWIAQVKFRSGIPSLS